jgi:hypothetical protein
MHRLGTSDGGAGVCVRFVLRHSDEEHTAGNAIRHMHAIKNELAFHII